jgi:hypothetical protein
MENLGATKEKTAIRVSADEGIDHSQTARDLFNVLTDITTRDKREIVYFRVCQHFIGEGNEWLIVTATVPVEDVAVCCKVAAPHDFHLARRSSRERGISTIAFGLDVNWLDQETADQYREAARYPIIKEGLGY